MQIWFGSWKVQCMKQSRSLVKIPMRATPTKFMGRPKLDMWDLIDSNVDLFMDFFVGITLLPHFP